MKLHAVERKASISVGWCLRPPTVWLLFLNLDLVFSTWWFVSFTWWFVSFTCWIVSYTWWSVSSTWWFPLFHLVVLSPPPCVALLYLSSPPDITCQDQGGRKR